MHPSKLLFPPKISLNYGFKYIFIGNFSSSLTYLYLSYYTSS
uniref:Uncharacterized protein n=1 Tax=Myoviridae sp. ct3pM2 TaxID=2827658 RepID=A0A8S5TDS3_9CAUD|nr:MAG TPA: hypothetical protein [Myoviridae sp. ct3pM2]DAN35016.1 MAG TPA: hypothetical protein [Caudoviricetes sp.]DAN61231.1 MAG TPA: hypothetical protein [Caudoviricetes sp.]